MGKNARRKHLEAIQREFFDEHGDARSVEERAQAREMLEKLQRKLEDDALREDGFWFIDGKYEDARRARVTPGMRVESYDSHLRRVGSIAVVSFPCDPAATTNTAPQQVVCTFGTDKICIWNFRPSQVLASVEITSLHALSICGAAVLDTAPTFGSNEEQANEPWLWVAYAPHHEPLLHGFTPLINRLYPSKCPLSKTPDMASSYCTGHQQQITCMSFSHDSKLLATGSWDSMCMLWRVPNRPKSIDPNHSLQLAPLSLVQRFPVDDCGVLCLSFAQDDSVLMACGECKIKVWDVVDIEPNGAETIFPRIRSAESLGNQLALLEATIPSSFSVEYSLRLAEFGESLPSLVPNCDWLVPHRHCSSEITGTTTTVQADPNPPIPDDVISSCITQCLQLAADTVEMFANQNNDPINKEDLLNECETDCQDGDAQGEDDPLLFLYTQTQLRTAYKAMDKFSFRELLDPAIGTSNIPPVIPTTDVVRSCRAFQDVTHDGNFAQHTAMITGCSVEKDLDLVVTVSYDRSIKYWRLSDGVVLETVREAHPAPISCCALTSASACLVAGFDMLLATGASDNMVKVWHRNSYSIGSKAECVYTLSGHYDSVKTLAFDPQAIFLVSGGDDTNAFAWRVRPSSPDTPLVPEVVTIDRYAITIRWVEPLANGARISHYVVRTTQLTALESAGTSLRAVPDVQVVSKYTTAVVEKLQPGVQYSLQIAAVNSIGSSAYSATTSPIETLAFVPSRIEKPVRYHDRRARSIRLSWIPPCPNGAVLQTYTIRCIPENVATVPVRELTISVSDAKLHKEIDKAESLSEQQNLEPTSVGKKGNKKTKASAEQDEKNKPPAKSTSKMAKRLTRLSGSSDSTEVSYTVDELWPGEIYQFVVAASNRCGLGDFSRVSDYVKMDSTAPDPPDQPIITSIGKRHVELEWTKPRCNGSEILQYTLHWTQDDALAAAECISDTKTSEINTVVLLAHSIVGTTYKLTNLLPGTVLRVWVSATNLIDNVLRTSLISPASDIIRTLCDVPDAPSPPPRLLSPSSHSLTLGWEAPRDNGLPIERYDAVLYQEEQQFGVNVKNVCREFSLARGDWEQSEASTTLLAFVICHLRGGCYYSTEVRAVNALGPGAASACSVPVSTLPATTPPALLLEPHVENVTPTAAKLSWSSPANDGGEPLSAYQIQSAYRSATSSTDEEEVIEETSLFDTSTEWNTNSLRPRRTYRFRVAARNSVGTGEFSPWSDFVSTPSLVEFTVSTYFANRPEIEHAKARVLQRRYRAWKVAVAYRAKVAAGLTIALAGWHIL